MALIAVVVGTRPDAIKLAPVVLALRRRSGTECRIWATAQHRRMLDEVLSAFDLTADADLDAMRPDQSLAALSARLLEGLDGLLAAGRPDLLLVQGDTTTALCGALAAFYRRVPVGHVEAGLRTGNLDAPWPEEANRVLVSRLAALHFAPTDKARENLLKEGAAVDRVHVTGNTVIDALLLAAERAKARPPEVPGLPAGFAADRSRRLVLVTGHRRESFGQGLESVCLAVADLAARFPDVDFVYPVHLNPNVRGPVERILKPSAGRNLFLLEPLPYLSFVAVMERATLLLTDSGGIQEEAPALGKPVLVMREVTERPEAVAAGAALLVGTDREKIVAETSRLLTDAEAYRRMAQVRQVYGDGKAAERIAALCTGPA